MTTTNNNDEDRDRSPLLSPSRESGGRGQRDGVVFVRVGLVVILDGSLFYVTVSFSFLLVYNTLLGESGRYKQPRHLQSCRSCFQVTRHIQRRSLVGCGLR
jgi:hypothetical protein